VNYDADTIIIGAGPAGLATAACLARAGIDYLVLERHDVPGSAWHNHYDRLHLHTVKRYSHLPYRPFPEHYPQYPSRQQVVDYLVDYASHFGIAPRFGHTVQSAVRDGDGWAVTTDKATFRARHLVCATGYSGVPKMPAWPGMDTFAGTIIHSSHFKNAADWRGKRAMVIGIGNSGAEIAIDLFEHGVLEPCISVRSPVHVLPRDMFGLLPAHMTGITMSRLPPKVADRLALPLINAVMGDLTRYGLRQPAIGPAEQVVTQGKIPLFDIGTIDLIKQGHLSVVPDVKKFTETEVVFVDGTRRAMDAIVVATGFAPALQRFFGDLTPSLVDRRGYPTHHGTEVPGRGLWFLGFRNPTIGQLNDIRLEAQRISGQVAAKSGRAAA